MTDEELIEEMTRRARAAGDTSGLYVESAVPMSAGGGRWAAGGEMHLVMRYRVGDRAFLAPADVDAIARRQAEVAALEAAVDYGDVAQLRREAAEGPLGRLERGEL